MKNKGFTLIELLVVIAIIAVLSTIGFAVFSGVQKGARDAKRRSDIDAIAKALEIYKSQNNTYTPATSFPCTSDFVQSLNDTTWGVNGSVTGCPASLNNAWIPSFFAIIPMDPNGNSGWNNYTMRVVSGTSYTIWANLEVPPSPALSCATQYFNYCLQNQQ